MLAKNTSNDNELAVTHSVLHAEGLHPLDGLEADLSHVILGVDRNECQG